MKSNTGIAEEVERIADYLTPKHERLSCPNVECENHGVALGTHQAYRSFGKTKQGAQRYQCARCRKTFSVALPTQYQRDTSVNNAGGRNGRSGYLRNVQTFGRWQDRWVYHPLPSMSEPYKAMCWLTEHNEGDLKDNEDHKAWLFNKASLHAVDSYFMKTRRRIHMCERPIRTSSNTRRIWSAYQAYNPAVLVKLLEIFRVVHNYIDTPDKEEKTTPAMRLGLADAVLDYGDVL